MIAKIILPHKFKVDYNCDLLVGVDYAAYQLAKQGKMMDLAIGDFDSVSEEEFKLIKQYSKKIVKLKEDKMDTDSEAALKYVSQLNTYEIFMYSSFGERLDHLLNNFRLLGKYNFTLIDDYNMSKHFSKGTYKINRSHKYFSLFTFSEAIVTIKNAKYELSEVSFTFYDSYLTSNEFISDYAIIEVLDNDIYLILSNDN